MKNTIEVYVGVLGHPSTCVCKRCIERRNMSKLNFNPFERIEQLGSENEKLRELCDKLALGLRYANGFMNFKDENIHEILSEYKQFMEAEVIR